jgi:hypothetical protein
MAGIKRTSLPVTYKIGSTVYHPSLCRSAQRIKNPHNTSLGNAKEMGLKPCRNCVHQK